MDAKRSFLNQHPAGILVLSVLLVFVVLVFSCGCTQSGVKTPGINESAAGLTETAKCGGAGEACCENNSCISSDRVLTCIKNKCTNINVTNISTEKPKYTANEEIKIAVDVDSTTDANNVSLHVYGITSRQGSHLIDQTLNLNLTIGVNPQNFTVTAPPCTQGCGARYFPGDYPLYAEISYFDEANNVSITGKREVNVNLY